MVVDDKAVTVHWMPFRDTEISEVEAADPSFLVFRLVPVRVTAVPPAEVPLAGLIAVIVGVRLVE